jgi:hypothetical protein
MGQNNFRNKLLLINDICLSKLIVVSVFPLGKAQLHSSFFMVECTVVHFPPFKMEICISVLHFPPVNFIF